MKKASSVILRIGIALVIIWFGYQQLSDPTSWIAYLPTWAGNLPISQLSIIYINGLFEVIAGTMLFFGLYTRWIALIVAIHMLDITYTVGYDAIGVRDFGLFIATLSVFFYGSSPFSIDFFFQDDEVSKSQPTVNRTSVPAAKPTPAISDYINRLEKSIPLNNQNSHPGRFN